MLRDVLPKRMTSHSERPAANRLLQLSEEVSRIATSLAQLSAEPATASREKGVARGEEELTVEEVDAVIHRRRQRSAYLPPDLLADPAWDMMLVLLRAEVMQRRASVSDLYAAAGVPETVAVRWLKSLEQRGLVLRCSRALYRQWDLVELTRDASSALRRWFADSFREGG